MLKNITIKLVVQCSDPVLTRMEKMLRDYSLL
jgi:hypothetical protein